MRWVREEAWQALTPAQKEKFPPLSPAFVVELRSASDRLEELQVKMAEYLRNGVELGWLLDPVERWAQVYRASEEPHLLRDPASMSGDPTLPGFVLLLDEIW